MRDKGFTAGQGGFTTWGKGGEGKEGLTTAGGACNGVKEGGNTVTTMGRRFCKTSRLSVGAVPAWVSWHVRGRQLLRFRLQERGF